MSDKTYTQEDIDNVKGALKQVISVPPQLLFEASKELATEIQMDMLEEKFAEKPNSKKYQALVFRGGLCLLLGKTLLQSGKASLSADDISYVASYLTLNK